MTGLCQLLNACQVAVNHATYDCLLLCTVDKGKQNAGEAGRQAHSGGKDETTPTTVPQSKVKVEPPSVEDVLRYPIEVFVSAGEPFIPAESEYSALHKMWYFICVHLWLLGVIFSLHTDKTA